MLQIASIKDIAREAGVSTTTVSRVFNQSSSVREATRKKVLEVAEHYAYTPNAFARGLVRGDSSTICVITPDILTPFYSELVSQISAEAKSRGYEIIWSNNFKDYDVEEKFFRFAASNQAAGILFSPVGPLSYSRLYKYMQRIPTVVIGDVEERGLFSNVCMDNEAAGAMGIRYLIERGCKDVLYACARVGRATHMYRLQGFLEEGAKHGITLRVLRYEPPLPGNSRDIGYREFLKYMQGGERMPDGIMAGSDNIALGVMQACDELGVRIPQDTYLLGVDNIAYSSLPQIMLSTIAQPKVQLVTEAFNMLEDRLKTPEEPHEPVTKLLPPHLVIRKSCGEANAH